MKNVLLSSLGILSLGIGSMALAANLEAACDNESVTTNYSTIDYEGKKFAIVKSGDLALIGEVSGPIVDTFEVKFGSFAFDTVEPNKNEIPAIPAILTSRLVVPYAGRFDLKVEKIGDLFKLNKIVAAPADGTANSRLKCDFGYLIVR